MYYKPGSSKCFFSTINPFNPHNNPMRKAPLGPPFYLRKPRNRDINLPQIVCVWKSLSCVQLFVTQITIQSMNSLGQNTGVGSRSLLQGIFPTQGSNAGLPHCRRILYHLTHEGSPRIIEWIAYPFSRGSSQLKNGTGVSCIAGRFFTSWATREALRLHS